VAVRSWPVKEGRPSFTARTVALARSQLSRPQTPEGDPEAERRLYAGLQMPLIWPLRRGAGLRMAARTGFFDAETLQAVTSGTIQVVIVGAGYDGRALRFRRPDVRFFEVDHPATQVDKRRRVEALGVALDHVSFVAVDLMSEGIEEALSEAGHRREKASLFLCEGLLLYLSRPVVENLLTGLRALAAPGSRLVLTCRETAPAGAALPHVLAWRLFLAAVGEPRRSRFEPGEMARLLDRSGWKVAREVRRSTREGSDRILVAADPA
jgi:methyltransferase (TIGR00027 family)